MVRKLKSAQALQAKYYDRKHRAISYEIDDLVLLSTVNLKVRGTPTKLQRKFFGPFRVIECVGTQAYKLALPKH